MAGGPSTFIVAFTLAREAADVLGVSGKERDALLEAALAIGQWVADQGRPGRWDALDPAAVLEAMCLPDEEAATAFVFSMMTLVGYAALHQRLALPAARRIIGELAELTGNPGVRAFAAEVLSQLRRIGH